MTEEQARAWIAARSTATGLARIDRFLGLVISENERQNLIAPSTIAIMWQRHALDSAQLLAFDRPDETWLDIGTGGGFPGMIVAILRDAPVVMVEPRARRAAFLAHAVEDLELTHARVAACRVERVQQPSGIISARAVASLDQLFTNARHCAGAGTRWILPKGRTAAADLRDAGRTWRGAFHVEQSIVDPDAEIVIAEGVERR